MNWLKSLFEKDTRLPHEIYPELLEWRHNDTIHKHYGGAHTSTYEVGKFICILDGEIHILHKYGHEIIKYSPKKARKKLINYSLRNRNLDKERQRLENAIPLDNYNQFLDDLRESNRLATQEFLNGKVI